MELIKSLFGISHQAKLHWMAQRITAILLVPLSIWLIFSVASLAGQSHSVVEAWASSSLNKLLLLVFVVAAFYHAILGLQVVFEDYISTEKTRTMAMLFCSISIVLALLISIISVV